MVVAQLFSLVVLFVCPHLFLNIQKHKPREIEHNQTETKEIKGVQRKLRMQLKNTHNPGENPPASK